MQIGIKAGHEALRNHRIGIGKPKCPQARRPRSPERAYIRRNLKRKFGALFPAQLQAL